MGWRNPPSFWSKKLSIFALLLWPISRLVTIIGRMRHKLSVPYRASVPVICVGNVVIGGSGKTPLVIALAKFLQQQGFIPHILSRGYGVQLDKPVRVADHHRAEEVGDEPLLLAKIAPTWVYADRCQTADLAIQAGATVLLMDDGLQNPTLYKDIQLLVIDGDQGVGNGYVLPAGSLREPFRDAVTRSHAILLYNKAALLYNKVVDSVWMEERPVFEVAMDFTLQPRVPRYIAFAGIGRPEKFFTSLRQGGFSLVKTLSFPDHHVYEDKEVQQLLALAEQYQARLITTEKDIVKIPSFLHASFDVLSVSAQFQEPSIFQKWLLQQLSNQVQL